MNLCQRPHLDALDLCLRVHDRNVDAGGLVSHRFVGTARINSVIQLILFWGVSTIAGLATNEWDTDDEREHDLQDIDACL